MDKGFVYTLEDEKIIEYMQLSTEEKLKWLGFWSLRERYRPLV